MIDFAGSIHDVQRQLTAVLQIDDSRGVGAGTGHELEVVGQTPKANLGVKWVDGCV